MDRGLKVSKKTMLDVLDAFNAYFKEKGTQNITYLEFSNYIENNGGGFINYFNELGDILGKLGEITSKLKLPILSTIIVNSGDELPAPGYFRMAALQSVYTRHDKQLDIKKNSQLENLTRKKRIEFIKEQKNLLRNLKDSDFERIIEEINLKYQ